MPASISSISGLFRKKKDNPDDITLETAFAKMLEEEVKGIESKKTKKRKKKKAKNSSKYEQRSKHWRMDNELIGVEVGAQSIASKQSKQRENPPRIICFDFDCLPGDMLCGDLGEVDDQTAADSWDSARVAKINLAMKDMSKMSESLKRIDRRLSALESSRPEEVGVQNILPSPPTSTNNAPESLERIDCRLNALELSKLEDVSLQAAGLPPPTSTNNKNSPVPTSVYTSSPYHRQSGGPGQAGAKLTPKDTNAPKPGKPDARRRSTTSKAMLGGTNLDTFGVIRIAAANDLKRGRKPTKNKDNKQSVTFSEVGPEPTPDEARGQEADVTHHQTIPVQKSTTANDLKIEPKPDTFEVGKQCITSPWRYGEEVDAIYHGPFVVRTGSVASLGSEVTDVPLNPHSFLNPPAHAGEPEKKSVSWVRGVVQKESKAEGPKGGARARERADYERGWVKGVVPKRSKAEAARLDGFRAWECGDYEHLRMNPPGPSSARPPAFVGIQSLPKKTNKPKSRKWFHKRNSGL